VRIAFVFLFVTAGCDGVWSLFLKQPAATTLTCDDRNLVVRLEERIISGKTRVRAGSVSLSPSVRYISFGNWASGGIPETVRVTLSCPSTHRVQYDSGWVSFKDRFRECSRSSLLTLLESTATIDQEELCKWLETPSQTRVARAELSDKDR
jgi:hypothetical protein